jgi:hypothetical protein
MLIPDQAISRAEPEDMPPAEEMENSGGAYQLKQLKPKHKNVLALVAQGVDRQTIAAACDITPEYVTMLCRMPICKQYIAGLNEACDLQLEAMYGKTIRVIDNALSNGNIKEQLVGARLHLEDTKRIGRPADISPQTESTNERLVRLAERLTALIPQPPVTINGSFTEVQSGTQLEEQPRLADSGGSLRHEAAPSDGNGSTESDEED